MSGGDVTASEADAIQDIAKYSGADSDYDITDNAAALISAGDDVLNVAGVDIVTASDTSVNANIGGDLAGFTADIEFDVSDTAANIAVRSLAAIPIPADTKSYILDTDLISVSSATYLLYKAQIYKDTFKVTMVKVRAGKDSKQS